MRLNSPLTDSRSLEELLNWARHGEISLPKFQRSFVWEKPDVLSLLDSIYKGYPIGNILLWRSSERLKSEREVFDFSIKSHEAEIYPTHYLLDGQQRLITIAGALFWEGGDPSSIWNIKFDLETETFVHYPRDPSVRFFPLNCVLNTGNFLRQCRLFADHPMAQLYLSNADKLRSAFKQYRIAVVTIEGTALEEIGAVFERINSAGRSLTLVDLMRARWSGEFDLSKSIEETNIAIQSLGFGEISENTILRSIAASAGFGINKTDIENLRKLNAAEISNAANNARSGILRALEFLRSKILLPDLSFLPNSILVTFLAEFFRICPGPNPDQIKYLVEWFWISSLTRKFSKSISKQNSSEILIMREVALGNIPPLQKVTREDVIAILDEDFDLRSSNSVAFSLLLLQPKPTLSLSGKMMDVGNILSLSKQLFKDLLAENSAFRGKNIGQVLDPYRAALNKNSVDLQSLGNLFLSEEAIKFLKSSEVDKFIATRRELFIDFVGKLGLDTGEPI